VLRFAVSVLAHRISAHFDSVCVVNEPIEDPVGHGGIADLLVPLADRKLRGEQRGTCLVAILADFPKVPTFGFAERGHGPVIDDEHIDAAEPDQELTQAAVGTSQSEIAEQSSRASVQRRVAIATSLLGQGTGYKAFPYSGGT